MWTLTCACKSSVVLLLRLMELPSLRHRTGLDFFNPEQLNLPTPATTGKCAFDRLRPAGCAMMRRKSEKSPKSFTE
ncbi:hypothetical protein M758_10G115600 [Ceratodon purpureus]|nr:hypothetical protein M758_10G115600 [Ceratodon purpureus]